MRLDVTALRYLDRDDFRVLTAVEMGMRNHDLVPVELVARIAALRLGGMTRILSTLLRLKLLHHDRQTFDGYRLTYLGYDFLALRALQARGHVSGVGRQIGVGKESDIFVVANEDEEQLCLKLHRLGRTSFRAIKNKRDYHKHRGSPSWLYLSRLAAGKEFAFMKALHAHGFPVPRPVDGNRHTILMGLVDGFPLNQVREMADPGSVYARMMELIVMFARHGLIHGDFNEFNVLVDPEGALTVIDFPQMVSIAHPNARMYFERDVNCVRRFFRKRFGFIGEERPRFEDALQDMTHRLDVEVSASGFQSVEEASLLDRFVLSDDVVDDDGDDGGEDVAGAEADEADELGAAGATAEEEDDSSDGSDDDDEEEEAAFTSIKLSKDVGDEDVLDTDALADDALDREDGTDDGQDAEDDDDGPQVYLGAETAAAPAAAAAPRAAPRLHDIMRRVRRDLGKRGGKGKGAKVSRNGNKSRDKRQLTHEMNTGGHNW